FARDLGQSRGLTSVHPYDDPLVIAGQGTIALEMLEDVPDLDVLVVPIGGGGLISGISVAAKAIRPAIEVVGVEAELYPSMLNKLTGQDLPCRGETLAEGIAVKSPGVLTEQIIRALVSEILLVSEVLLERAVAQLIEIEKTVVEGAGAAGLAAMLADPARFAGRNVGIVLAGGNIDTRLLASVLTREMARAGRLSELDVDLSDRPGQLARLTAILAANGANVIEVVHQRVFTDTPAKGALARLVIETRDRAHLEQTVEQLKAAGVRVETVGRRR
ncbi:MAG: pyridoxal-phosphate dependent enzyme, partial [Hyphomicrobiaceae bacterium]